MKEVEVQSFFNAMLTEVSKDISTKTYQDIVFPEFVRVRNDGDPHLERRTFLKVEDDEHRGSGIVSLKTNVFDNVNVKYTAHVSVRARWLKTATWTDLELGQASKLGVALDKDRLLALNRQAHFFLQNVAFVGAGNDNPEITGLLNNKEVGKIEEKSKKVIASMNYQEAVDHFTNGFVNAISQMQGHVRPDTLAISGVDYMALASKTSPKSERPALEMLTQQLSNIAGKAVSVKAIPKGFAENVNGGEKNRAIVYSRDESNVFFDVPESPRLLPIQKTGLLSYQAGLLMTFGSVVFIRPETACYFEY